MAKLWGAKSFLALALLGCLVGTEVEAQDPSWSKPTKPMSKGSSPPQHSHTPQVPHRPPQAPSYPERPQVPHRPPQAPSYPERPQVQFRPQQDYHTPQKPGQHPSPPQTPGYPQRPGQQSSPPQTPGYPQRPGQQSSPPQTLDYRQKPRPSPPDYTKHSTKLPPRTAPKSPQHQQTPQYSPFARAYPDQQVREPQVTQPEQPHGSNQGVALSNRQASIPKFPSFDTCQVADSQKIHCGGPDISPAECESINCCFDGRKCHFAKAVTVQCTKDAFFIVIVGKDATVPRIDLETISMQGHGPGCTHVDSNSDFAIYYFAVTDCGTEVTEDSGVIIYKNSMSSAYEIDDGPNGRITRDTKYEFFFECRYTSTSVKDVVIELLAGMPLDPVAGEGPVRVQLRLANGYCQSKGCNEAEVAYTSFFTKEDYPIQKVLRDPVYVEVELLERTDPSLVLTLGHCWTTTTTNPHSLPRWDILVDGCPNSNDHYLSSMIPVGPSSGLLFPTHYKRFVFKMFTFVDPNAYMPLNEQVYIHCSTAVCVAKPGAQCDPLCYRKKREVKDADTKKAEPMAVVSVGPIIMTAPEA